MFEQVEDRPVDGLEPAAFGRRERRRQREAAERCQRGPGLLELRLEPDRIGRQRRPRGSRSPHALRVLREGSAILGVGDAKGRDEPPTLASRQRMRLDGSEHLHLLLFVERAELVRDTEAQRLSAEQLTDSVGEALRHLRPLTNPTSRLAEEPRDLLF